MLVLTGEVIVDFHVLANEVIALKQYRSQNLFAFLAIDLGPLLNNTIGFGLSSMIWTNSGDGPFHLITLE